MNKALENYFFNASHIGILDARHPEVLHLKFGHEKSNFEGCISVSVKNNRVQKACFKAFAPPFLIAALEWLCIHLEDKGLYETLNLSPQTLANLLEADPKNADFMMLLGIIQKLRIATIDKNDSH